MIGICRDIGVALYIRMYDVSGGVLYTADLTPYGPGGWASGRSQACTVLTHLWGISLREEPVF